MTLFLVTLTCKSYLSTRDETGFIAIHGNVPFVISSGGNIMARCVVLETFWEYFTILINKHLLKDIDKSTTLMSYRICLVFLELSLLSRCQWNLCSKLKLKILERHQMTSFLVSLLLTLNRFHWRCSGILINNFE